MLKDKNIVLDTAFPGAEIHMQYNYMAPVYFIVSNPESIAQWGLRQRVIVDTQMRNSEQSLMLAERILEEYSEPVLRGTCEVFNGEAYNVGDTAWVEVPELGISGPMLVNAIEHDIHRDKGRTTRLHLGKPRVDLAAIISNLSSRVTALEMAYYRSDVLKRRMFTNREACEVVESFEISIGEGTPVYRIGFGRIGHARIN